MKALRVRETPTPRLPGLLAAGLAALLVATAGPVLARSSDRNQPMEIDAGRTNYSINESQPTVLSDGVHIVQGTLDIHSSRAEIRQRNGEPVRVVLTGSPVKLDQELDNGSPMNATAARIEYNLVDEVLVLTGNVHITQPDNSLASERVVYNMRTGQVTGGGDGAGRVHLRILPKNGAADAGAGGDADAGDDAEDTSRPAAQDADAPPEGG